MKAHETIKDIFRKLNSEKYKEFKDKNDEEIIKYLDEQYQWVNKLIEDRIEIHQNETARRLLILPRIDNKKLEHELMLLNGIDALRPLVLKIRQNLAVCNENQMVLDKRPFIEGATVGALSKGKASTKLPEDVSRRIASFFTEKEGNNLIRTTKESFVNAKKDQKSAEKKLNKS